MNVDTTHDLIQSFLLHQIYWFSCCYASPQFLLCNVWKIWITMKYYLCPFWEKRGAGKRYSFLLEKTRWKTWCAKTKQGKIQQKAFSCWEWMGCQGVYLAVMDGSCSFPSFTTCEVVWSLKGLHLRAWMNDACSLFLVVAMRVQTGAVADGKTGIFPLNKSIQAMPGQKCGCAGLMWGAQAWLQVRGIRSASPQRSSGQSHSLASGMAEQG